jgi:methyl coenzyme M reductase subunit C
MLLLEFEDLVVHYPETRHISWNSAHIFSSTETPAIILVFSPVSG